MHETGWCHDIDDNEVWKFWKKSLCCSSSTQVSIPCWITSSDNDDVDEVDIMFVLDVVGILRERDRFAIRRLLLLVTVVHSEFSSFFFGFIVEWKFPWPWRNPDDAFSIFLFWLQIDYFSNLLMYLAKYYDASKGFYFLQLNWGHRRMVRPSLRVWVMPTKSYHHYLTIFSFVTKNREINHNCHQRVSWCNTAC